MSAIPWIPGMFRHVLAPPGMEQQAPADSRKQWYINDHCIFVDSTDRLLTHCGIEDRHWSDIGAPYGLWLAELDWAERK
jgi:hypothetical protein